MKKTLKISLIVMVLFIVFAFSNSVLAVEVSNMDELRAAIEGKAEQAPATEVTLTASFDISGQSPKTSRATILSITDSITINGNGHKLTANSLRSMFDIYDNAGKDVVVTFNNIKLVNSAASARCIDMRDSSKAGNITLNLNGVTLDTSSAAPNAQALTVGGNYSDTDVLNITNSVINAGNSSYPVMTYNKANISITGSTLNGYCSLYMQGKNDFKNQSNSASGSADSVVKIVNSTLEATTVRHADTNNFSVFQIEDTGIKIDVIGTEIYSKGDGLNNLLCERFMNGVDKTKSNVITLSSSTYINKSLSSKNKDFEFNSANDPITHGLTDNSKLIFNEGVKLNVYKVSPKILNNNGVKHTVVVSGDLYEIKKIYDPIIVDGKEKIIDFDVKANGCDGAIFAKNNANVIINGGKIHGQVCPEDGYARAVYANGSTVTINGGTFTNDLDPAQPNQADLIYVKNGAKIYIKGGTFQCSTPARTLNAKDPSQGQIIVTGGRFYKFDPSNNKVSAAGSCDVVVPDTHKVVQDGEWFEVVCAHTDLKEHTLKEATITEEGCLPYFECNNCHKLFADKAATKETTKEDLILDKLIEVKGTEAIVSDAAVLGAIQDAEGSKVIELPVLEATSTVKEVTVPVASIEAIAAENKELLIETADVTVTLDAKTMDTVANEAKDATKVTIEVVKTEEKILNTAQKDAVKDKEVAVVISAKILADGKEISDFKGGKVTVEIPFKPAEGTTIADYKFIYIDDNGNVTEMPYKYIDGVVVVELEHFSEYAIAKNAKTAVEGGTEAPAPAPAPAAPEKDNTPKTGAVSFIGIIAVISIVGLVVLKRD